MKEDIILCPRCGEPMKRDQRNCLKCGQLNHENPNNAYMKKYETATGNQSAPYVIGQGMVTNTTSSGLMVREMLADKAGNLALCAIINILFYVGGVVLLFLVAFIGQRNLTLALLDRVFSISLILYSLFFIEVYALELLFMKANKPWWAALVPIYNLYLLYQIATDNGWLFLLTFIPFVGVIASLALLYKLGKAYGKNPWLTLLFGFVMIPVIGFDSTINYKGILYVNMVKGKAPIEILYKWNKRILSLALVFAFTGVVSISYNNRQWFIYKFYQIRTFSFVRDAKLIVEDAKRSIQEDDYTCSNYLPIDQQGTYYIEFDNAGAYFGSEKVSDSTLSMAYYRGYIKVVHSDKGDTKYYIAVDDTLYGMSEIEESKIRKSYAKKGTSTNLPEGAVVCSKINLD